MKYTHTFSTMILTLGFLSLQAQVNEPKGMSADTKREFKNQGEQEDYWAEQFFKNQYLKQIFTKYDGEIIVNGEGFLFLDQTLVVTNTPKELRNIVAKGIFYPSVITGQINTKIKSKEQLDTLSVEQKAFYNLTRTDSLTISNLEELTFLNKQHTQKRFRFWLYRKGILNSTVCFLELKNKDATT